MSGGFRLSLALAVLALLCGVVETAMAQGEVPGPLGLRDGLSGREGAISPPDGGGDLPAATDSNLDLRWTSFFGGTEYDYGHAIAVGPDGRVTVAGEINSDADGAIWWGCSGTSDVFVARLSGGGTTIWTTMMGGDGYDCAIGVTVDADGNVFVAGESEATWGDNPKRAFAGAVDVFVAKLDTDGNLIWNTFLGANYADFTGGIALDGNGNVFVVGTSYLTWGSPLRAHAPQWYDLDYPDAFVAGLSGDGSLLWNTFLGGQSTDYGHAVAVGADGDVFVSGEGVDWGDPVHAFSSAPDAFAARLDSDGDLIWNTFLEGEDSYGLAVAADGSVYVTGDSGPWGDPVREYTAGADVYVVKLSEDGGLEWNTYLGGEGNEGSTDIVVSDSGLVYVGGGSNATWGSPQLAYSGSFDIFVASVDADGHLVENTFLGGSGYDVSFGIASTADGFLYVTGVTQSTWGRPVHGFTANADAFAAKLGPELVYLYSINLPLVLVDSSGLRLTSR